MMSAGFVRSGSSRNCVLIRFGYGAFYAPCAKSVARLIRSGWLFVTWPVVGSYSPRYQSSKSSGCFEICDSRFCVSSMNMRTAMPCACTKNG